MGLRETRGVVLLVAGVSVTATMLFLPHNHRRFPGNIAEFAHLSAGFLNARDCGDYRVIADTGGQEQFWITADANAGREDMLKKSKLLMKIDQWKDTVVAFHNDRFGTIASDPDERAGGCVRTVGRFVLFGDPQLIEKIKVIWGEAEAW